MSKLVFRIFRCFEGTRGTRNQLKTELEKCLKEVEDLERQLEEAERRIDVMDWYICDEDRPRIERELKEKVK